MKLHCFALHGSPPAIVPARASRQWMDDFPDRHAYRCLPLSIANAHGWEILCPVAIEIAWNGGERIEDLTVRAVQPSTDGRPVFDFCRSHFACGIVTFHTDYIFQTGDEWDLLATGPFNSPKQDIYPLTGIIETNWLPYPFTMNWQVMKPGRVVFEKDEPFCFIFPVKKHAVLDCEPEIYDIGEDLDLMRRHQSFAVSRTEFMKRFDAKDPAALKNPWLKHYFRGRHPDGESVDNHVSKLRVAAPVDKRRRAAAALEVDPLRAASSWRAGGLLDKLNHRQTQLNELGRGRITGEGRLRARAAVTDAHGSGDGSFLIVENFLSVEICRALCDAFLDLSARIVNRMPGYWDSRFIWYSDVVAHYPEAAMQMLQAQRSAAALIADFYELTAPIYPDLLQIMSWPAGIHMTPHADNAYPDGSPHPTAHRDFSGIVYLNDDYEGGEFYFTALDTMIKPKTGTLLAFTAGFHHEHAVLRVEGTQRLTMPFFLTFDKTRADPLLG